MNDLKDITDFLFANRVKDLPPRGLAEVFDRLIWCLSDNGQEILKIQREWLSSQDVERVKIALEMKEAFPFENPNQMNQVLKSISANWPELRVKCDETAARWHH
jgi:hypothetical protein